MNNLFQAIPKMAVFFVVLLCFTFGCQQQVEEGLTEVEANAILEKILKVYNEGDLALVDEIIAEGNRLHHSAYPEDIVGLDAFKDYVTNTRTALKPLVFAFFRSRAIKSKSKRGSSHIRQARSK